MIWGISEETECVLHGKRKPQETVITIFKYLKACMWEVGKMWSQVEELRPQVEVGLGWEKGN